MKYTYFLFLVCLLTATARSQNSEQGFQWIRTHGEQFSRDVEIVRDIQTDRFGNVYVAGSVNDLFVRDSTGANVPSIEFPFLDSLENYGGRDVWLAKYDPQGNLLWHRYAGSGSDEDYYDMVADQEGNCYISGNLRDHIYRKAKSFGGVPIGDLNRGTFIAKVDRNGDLLWHRSFGGDTIGNFLQEYRVSIYNLHLTDQTISAFIRGGGEQAFGYQELFGKDSLIQGAHEVNFDLNGNYKDSKTFDFPKLFKIPQILNISKNDKGTFVTGILDQDTILVGNDTLFRKGFDNAVVLAFDSTLTHENSFQGNTEFDQFFDAQIFGDTLVAAGHFDLFVDNTVTFDTINYTGGVNEGQAGGVFLFDATSTRLIGFYPSKSLGFTPTVQVGSSHLDALSFGIGGNFDEKMTFSGTNSYMEAVERCTSCIGNDLFFALFSKSGRLIAEDVIYSSTAGNDRVIAMHRKDSILYIGGFIGGQVIINGVDSFTTKGADDAFVAAYNIGLITSLDEVTNTFIKANNGILAYPNPTSDVITLLGKAVGQEAQLFSISGQLVHTYRLDQFAFRQPLDLTDLDSGIYFLVIHEDQEKQQLKIIKQ